MQTLEHGNDWVVWIEQLAREEKSSNVAVPPTHSNESHADLWNKTDRQLHFRAAQPTSAPVGYGSSTQPGDGHSARARWLQEHNVHTEFLDAGIGCCWFAQLGDDEPVCGDTEEAAIRRLVRENGLFWGEPSKRSDGSAGCVG